MHVGHTGAGSQNTARQTEHTKAVPSTVVPWQKQVAERSTRVAWGARSHACRSAGDGKNANTNCAKSAGCAAAVAVPAASRALVGAPAVVAASSK